MANLRVKIEVLYKSINEAQVQDYPADDFEQANEAIPLAAELLGDVILRTLEKAGVYPKHPQGGEDKGVKDV